MRQDEASRPREWLIAATGCAEGEVNSRIANSERQRAFSGWKVNFCCLSRLRNAFRSVFTAHQSIVEKDLEHWRVSV